MPMPAYIDGKDGTLRDRCLEAPHEERGFDVLVLRARGRFRSLGRSAVGKKPKTRINGEGSIYKRQSDGRWVGQYFDHTAVPPKYRYVYAKTQAEALQRLNEAMASLGSGLDFDAGRITLGEFLNR